MQGPPGGHRGSALGIAHVVCAVDRQALQMAAGLGCGGLVRGEVVGCGERREGLAACSDLQEALGGGGGRAAWERHEERGSIHALLSEGILKRRGDVWLKPLALASDLAVRSQPMEVLLLGRHCTPLGNRMDLERIDSGFAHL